MPSTLSLPGPAALATTRDMPLRVAAVGLALAIASGCGSVAKHPPAQSGVDAYRAALSSDDPRPAYELLSKAQRADISFEEFSASWKERQLEREQRAELLATEPGGLMSHAEVSYPDGGTLRLDEATGGWRLSAPFAASLAARSPRDAALELVRQLDSSRLVALIDLLSSQRRESIRDQLEVFRSSLAAHLEASPGDIYRSSKERAEIRWSYEKTLFRVVFVLEGRQWKLDDIHLGPDPVDKPIEDEEPSEVDAGIDLRRF